MNKILITSLLLFAIPLSADFNNQKNKEKKYLNNKEMPNSVVAGLIGETAGMFAHCNHVMAHLHLYDLGYYERLTVNFGVTGCYYDRDYGPNWWQYYFEPIYLDRNPANIDKEFTKKSNSEYPERDKTFRKKIANLRKDISKERASYIIKKYIKIKAHILNKVDKFTSKKFKNFFIYGVHYRGTDKVESPRIGYEDAIKIIKDKISELSSDNYKIFVATDEQAFLDYIEEQFPGNIIYADAQRSSDDKSVHHNTKNPYKAGEEALIDVLLLSKCDFLFRTSSNLSLWAEYFNPELPVLMLSHRYGGRE